MTTQKYESPNIVMKFFGVADSEQPVFGSLYAHDTGTFTAQQIEELGFELPGGFEALNAERDNELEKFLWDDFYKKGGKTYTDIDQAFADLKDLIGNGRK
ncbi:hypothetical protein [Burkholderia multivorans]|uniref:hypothetical protein n=1 Tax=Burkholderia multivorans TaxID=87883 RepID=UPI0011B4DE4A|nr:hypothetical protein [Burkholderia multivorans]